MIGIAKKLAVAILQEVIRNIRFSEFMLENEILEHNRF